MNLLIVSVQVHLKSTASQMNRLDTNTLQEIHSVVLCLPASLPSVLLSGF